MSDYPPPKNTVPVFNASNYIYDDPVSLEFLTENYYKQGGTLQLGATAILPSNTFLNEFFIFPPNYTNAQDWAFRFFWNPAFIGFQKGWLQTARVTAYEGFDVAFGLITSNPSSIDLGLNFHAKNALQQIVNTPIAFTQNEITTSVPIRAAAGSVTVPSISFTGDSNTGIYSGVADQLNITTNGVNRMRISNNGVRIGATGSDLKRVFYGATSTLVLPAPSSSSDYTITHNQNMPSGAQVFLTAINQTNIPLVSMTVWAQTSNNFTFRIYNISDGGSPRQIVVQYLLIEQ